MGLEQLLTEGLRIRYYHSSRPVSGVEFIISVIVFILIIIYVVIEKIKKR